MASVKKKALYNINDKDTTNIVSLQMNVGFNRYVILNYMASTIYLLEKLQNVKRKMDKLS
jgi:hypothetical protein